MNRIKETITLPDGKKIEVLNYAPNCENCGVPCELELCPACIWLKYKYTNYAPRMWGDNQGLVNRRWQQYFNRGELEPSIPDDFEFLMNICNHGWRQAVSLFGCTTPLWETKRKVQDW